MTIAESILSRINRADIVACTLAGGYLVERSGHRVAFAPGRIEAERRNEKGRCTYTLARYSDGSGLEFRFSENRGASYRLAK